MLLKKCGITYVTIILIMVLCVLSEPAFAGWEPIVELKAPYPCENAYFGYSASIDNGTAAIGAYGRNNNQGVVYVYDINGLNNWNYITTLLAPDLNDTDEFGFRFAQMFFCLSSAYSVLR